MTQAMLNSILIALGAGAVAALKTFTTRLDPTAAAPPKP
jgi:hypothetical protein